MPLPNTIIREPFCRAPKGIIYGPPGSGKTTFGASTDSPIIIDCENGAAHVKCDRTPYLSSWPEIERWLNVLANETHSYRTIVIDSIDWLLRRIEEHVAGVNRSESGLKQTLNRSHGGYGAGRQVLKNYVYQYLLPTLDHFVNSNIAVVLLAHASRRTITSIEGIEIEKSAPEIHADLANTMIEWSDFVGAIRVVGQDRELILNETPQMIAKNRYGIRDVLPLSWTVFAQAITPKKGD